MTEVGVALPELFTDETGWGRFARTPFQTREWYSAAGFADRAHLITAGGAGVPVWTDADPDHYYHSPRQILTGHLERAFLGSSWPGRIGTVGERWGQVTTTVSPYGYRGGAFAPEGAALDGLAVELIRYARHQGAGLVMSHYLFDGEDDEWLRALRSAGAEPLVLGAQCVLDVEWASAAEYYAELGGSRRSIRQRYAQWQRNGYTVRVRPVDEPCDDRETDQVVRLFAEHARRHGDSSPPLGLYRTLATGTGGVARLLVTVSEGATLRSALAVLVWGDTLFPKCFGSDHPQVDYLPLVYDEVVALAVTGRYRRVDYGGGAHQAKLFRGATLRYALGALVADPASPFGAALLAHAKDLSTRKLTHFRDLAIRWHRGHLAPPMPGILSQNDKDRELVEMSVRNTRGDR